MNKHIGNLICASIGLTVMASVSRGLDRGVDAAAVTRAAVGTFGPQPETLTLVGSSRRVNLLGTSLQSTFRLPDETTCTIEVRRSVPFAPWRVVSYERQP